MSYHPTGIVAVVDLVHKYFWIDFAINQRLVAYAIGLSLPDLNKSDFEKHMAGALAILEVKENLAGIVTNPESARSHLEDLWGIAKDSSCKDRTTVMFTVIAREGWLVENRNNSVS